MLWAAQIRRWSGSSSDLLSTSKIRASQITMSHFTSTRSISWEWWLTKIVMIGKSSMIQRAKFFKRQRPPSAKTSSPTSRRSRRNTNCHSPLREELVRSHHLEEDIHSHRPCPRLRATERILVLQLWAKWDSLISTTSHHHLNRLQENRASLILHTSWQEAQFHEHPFSHSPSISKIRVSTKTKTTRISSSEFVKYKMEMRLSTDTERTSDWSSNASRTRETFLKNNTGWNCKSVLHWMNQMMKWKSRPASSKNIKIDHQHENTLKLYLKMIKDTKQLGICFNQINQVWI